MMEADTKREKYLQQTHGISSAEYAQLLSLQNGVCSICGRAPKTQRLAVEHCHKTGIVRGLCCHRCNKLLGEVYDDPAVLLSAAAYLNRWSVLSHYVDHRPEYRGGIKSKKRRATIKNLHNEQSTK